MTKGLCCSRPEPCQASARSAARSRRPPTNFARIAGPPTALPRPLRAPRLTTPPRPLHTTPPSRRTTKWEAQRSVRLCVSCVYFISLCVRGACAKLCLPAKSASVLTTRNAQGPAMGMPPPPYGGGMPVAGGGGVAVGQTIPVAGIVTPMGQGYQAQMLRSTLYRH